MIRPMSKCATRAGKHFIRATLRSTYMLQVRRKVGLLGGFLLTINIMEAAMVYRILGVAKGTNGISGRLYFKICRILSESGILFALSSVVNLIALTLDTNPYTGTIPRKLFNSIVNSIHPRLRSPGAHARRSECFCSWNRIQLDSYPHQTRTY